MIHFLGIIKQGRHGYQCILYQNVLLSSIAVFQH